MSTRRNKLETWIRERNPKKIEHADFEELLKLLAPIDESALRHLLRETTVPLHPLAAGVNQDSFETLRTTLLALAKVYELGTVETRRLCRAIVITAKDHAKLAARNHRVTPEKREQKVEMISWMLTWLENPLVFPLWMDLRVRAAQPETGIE